MKLKFTPRNSCLFQEQMCYRGASRFQELCRSPGSTIATLASGCGAAFAQEHRNLCLWLLAAACARGREGTGTFYYANGAYYHGDARTHLHRATPQTLPMCTSICNKCCCVFEEWKGNVKEGHGRHTFDDGKVYDGSLPLNIICDAVHSIVDDCKEV